MAWSVPPLSRLLKIAAATWLCGALAFLLRLVVGLAAIHRIVKRSSLVQPLSRLARHTASESTTLQVRESDDIHVPVTVGLLRPTILLPPEWRDWTPAKLDAVMTHETAHVQRCDFLFSVLAEVNRSIHWFNPLSWWLRKRMGNLAEEACDDAAVGQTGDRAAYARCLLEVASQVTHGGGRACQLGLSMARQANVETRIHRVLDSGRPLCKPLSWATVAGIIAVVLPAIGFVAAVQGVNATAVAQTAEPPAGAKPSPPIGAVTKADSDQAKPSATVTLSGRTLDIDGKPIPGAKIVIRHSTSDQQIASTDSDGQFRAICDKKTAASGLLIAVAEGYGFAFANPGFFEEARTIHRGYSKALRAILPPGPFHELRMKKGDVSLKGRLVDVDGRPIPEVRVQIETVWEKPLNPTHGLGFHSLSGSFDDWERNAMSKDLAKTADSALLTGMSGVGAPSRTLGASIQYAKDGSFRIDGIGRERIVQFVVSAAGFESKRVFARTRHGDTILVPYQTGFSPQTSKKRTFYGPNFTHTAKKAQPVIGRITDRHTGEPIPNCALVAKKIAGDSRDGLGNWDFIRSKSDANGAFRIDGFPAGENELVLLPDSDSFYVPEGREFRTTDSSQPLTINVQLTKGARVTGKAIDETGKPQQGSVVYFAYHDNPELRGKHGVKLPVLPANFIRTNKDGSFTAVVLPGRGLLGFRADGIVRLGPPVNRPHRFLSAAFDRKKPNLLWTKPTQVKAKSFHSLLAIDPSPGESLEATLTLTKAD